FNIIVKMVDEPDTLNEQEEDPDVYYISRNESHLQVANWIYEFVNLSIPLQKTCSPEEMGGPKCNKEVLEKLRKMEEEATKDSTPTVWKGLEKFKDLE
ncbi:MAG: YceD family protein, partial [Sediminibacterium sp.]|nr:YceD family protein [Sediminibacterium sp.]